MRGNGVKGHRGYKEKQKAYKTIQRRKVQSTYWNRLPMAAPVSRIPPVAHVLCHSFLLFSAQPCFVAHCLKIPINGGSHMGRTTRTIAKKKHSKPRVWPAFILCFVSPNSFYCLDFKMRHEGPVTEVFLPEFDKALGTRNICIAGLAFSWLLSIAFLFFAIVGLVPNHLGLARFSFPKHTATILAEALPLAVNILITACIDCLRQLPL